MRGEWIEMGEGFDLPPLRMQSLPMRGEWIEICNMNVVATANAGLSPCGESGLKSAG